MGGGKLGNRKQKKNFKAAKPNPVKPRPGKITKEAHDSVEKRVCTRARLKAKLLERQQKKAEDAGEEVTAETIKRQREICLAMFRSGKTMEAASAFHKLFKMNTDELLDVGICTLLDAGRNDTVVEVLSKCGDASLWPAACVWARAACEYISLEQGDGATELSVANWITRAAEANIHIAEFLAFNAVFIKRFEDEDAIDSRVAIGQFARNGIHTALQYCSTWGQLSVWKDIGEDEDAAAETIAEVVFKDEALCRRVKWPSEPIGDPFLTKQWLQARDTALKMWWEAENDSGEEGGEDQEMGGEDSDGDEADEDMGSNVSQDGSG
eukprot:CAMPEP_0204329154 /NCGR_PEP_ID=MMETSP0469-20131031/13941_1 /ASSEMBLY_ACC=CAM_ASM_000384 /TAXON_ID=2969 /ORGANISM="Oxyrrhis marina" /LENGTH=323 /DNA_ID=CAMNT_0051311707 /DNA_START=46 /DNA_END=1017 /DNA_ORIENTATION=-